MPITWKDYNGRYWNGKLTCKGHIGTLVNIFQYSVKNSRMTPNGAPAVLAYFVEKRRKYLFDILN